MCVKKITFKFKGWHKVEVDGVVALLPIITIINAKGHKKDVIITGMNIDENKVEKENTKIITIINLKYK